MSRATEILSEEHRIIERVLGAIEGVIQASRENRKLDGHAAAMALDFIKTFADRCHHGKEEDELFARLEERGMERDSGPLGVMLHEHGIGRECVSVMEQHLAAAVAGDATSLAAFAEAADGYIDLLRNHIMKEDQILYPMSDGFLSEADQQELLTRFEVLCERDAALLKKYRAVADELVRLFGEGSS